VRVGPPPWPRDVAGMQRELRLLDPSTDLRGQQADRLAAAVGQQQPIDVNTDARGKSCRYRARVGITMYGAEMPRQHRSRVRRERVERRRQVEDIVNGYPECSGNERGISTVPTWRRDLRHDAPEVRAAPR